MNYIKINFNYHLIITHIMLFLCHQGLCIASYYLLIQSIFGIQFMGFICLLLVKH